MRITNTNSKVQLLCATLIVLSASALYSQTGPPGHIPVGGKARITGTIVSRTGDSLSVRQKKSAGLIIVNLFEDTKFERKGSHLQFFRHPRMDVTAMLPGLTIAAEGVGNSSGQLDARSISFKPDVFAIEIAQEQRIEANRADIERAQATAERGVETATAAEDSARTAQASAKAAQASANDAQEAANQASDDAQAAGELGILDAAAVQMINKRVSDLDGYKTVAEASIYFGNGNAALDRSAKNDLDQIADVARSLDGYMIEIAGYASRPGSRELNQKLSEERAAAVADYLRESKNVPMRRILAPAGYGATRLVENVDNPSDRPLERRVDVKVLVNKSLGRLK